MAKLDLIFANDRAFLAERCGHTLASTRARYLVGTPPEPSAAQLRDAEALLAQVSRGLWRPSDAAMAGYRTWTRRREKAPRRIE